MPARHARPTAHDPRTSPLYQVAQGMADAYGWPTDYDGQAGVFGVYLTDPERIVGSIGICDEDDGPGLTGEPGALLCRYIGPDDDGNIGAQLEGSLDLVAQVTWLTVNLAVLGADTKPAHGWERVSL